MKRFITVVLVAALMTATIVAPAFATTGTVKFRGAQDGTAVAPVVCDVLADDSSMFEWRDEGVCWVVHPVSGGGSFTFTF